MNLAFVNILGVFLGLAALHAEAIKLDFGTTNSPVWPGFSRVTETSPLLSCSNRLVSFWRTTPDELAGDGVVAVRGGFNLKIPIANGQYQVWVLSGDTVNGGYSEIRHLLQKVAIRAQGRRVFEQQRDYWYAEKFDYNPRADVWERYAGTNRFLEATFGVTVKGRALDLQFEGLTGPRYDYAFPLNAVMVFPVGDRDQMEQELAAIRMERRRQWSRLFPQVNLPEPDRPWTPDASAQDRGYAVWWRDYLDKVYPNTVPRPDEFADVPRPFATLGEWEPITFCIRPLTDLGRITLTISDLQGPTGVISQQQMHPYLVRYNENVLRSGLWYAAEPWALIPWKNPDIPSNVTRQCWLKIQVPTNAVPGTYTGSITVTPENAVACHLSYRFQVLPFALERSTNASFFYFGSRARIEFDTSAQGWFNNPDWWRFYDIEASNLVAHGFVPVPEITVGTPGMYAADATPEIDSRTNLVGLDWSKAATKVAWLASKGYLPPDRMWVVHSEGYGRIYCGGRFNPGPWWNPDPAYSNLFCQITRAVDRQVRGSGWGLPVFEWGGELSNFGASSLGSAINAYDALKSCGTLTALRGNGWVDWSLYATNRLVDFPTPNIALLRDTQTAWLTNHCRALWLYNFGGSRYAFGFFAWAKGATRRLHEGHLNDSGAPWDKFDGDHYQWERGVEATRDGVAPLVQLEWMAEGRDDYDYVNTLESCIKRVPPGPAHDAARSTLDFIRSRCLTDIVFRGDPAEVASVDEAVRWRDLQTWRTMLAKAILQLSSP